MKYNHVMRKAASIGFVFVILAGCSTAHPTPKQTFSASSSSQASSQLSPVNEPKATVTKMANGWWKYQNYGFEIAYPADATIDDSITDFQKARGERGIRIRIPELQPKLSNKEIGIDIGTLSNSYGKLKPDNCSLYQRYPDTKTINMAGVSFLVSKNDIDCAGTETDCDVVHYCTMRGDKIFKVNTRIMYGRYTEPKPDLEEESRVFKDILSTLRFVPTYVMSANVPFKVNDYSITFPAGWKVVQTKSDEEVELYSIADASGKPLARLKCPITEAGYEAWDFKQQNRTFQTNGITYDIDFWLGTPQASANVGPLNILFMHRGEDFAQTCEIVSFGAGIDAKTMEKIYESVR